MDAFSGVTAAKWIAVRALATIVVVALRRDV